MTPEIPRGRGEFGVIGVSHHTAPLSLRERLAVGAQGAPGILERARALPGVREALLLSTCNRTEMYLVASDGEGTDEVPSIPGEETACAAWSEWFGVEVDLLRPVLYRRTGTEALRHLLRVVAGLDALAVGETQVLAQAREAYVRAVGADAAGPVLHRVFQGAFRAARRAHAEAPIERGRNSVSAVAVDLIGKVFERLAGRTALVLGAGAAGGETARLLAQRGVREIVVVNRDPARAAALVAEVGGRAASWDQMDDLLPAADVVVGATDAPVPVLRADRIARAMRARRSRPMFLVDIAVPRDIEEEAGRLPNVYLYNLDDLQAVVDEASARRERSVQACQEILEEEVPRLAADAFETPEVAALLRRLQEEAERVRGEELSRALPSGGTPLSAQEVDRLTRRIVRRMLHVPMVRLRREGANGHASGALEWARRLLGL